MIKKIPLALLIIIVIISLVGSYIPLVFKSTLYAVSLTIKETIILFLPFIIFILLFNATVKISQTGSKLLLLILSCVCISNFFSTLLSYFVGSWVYGFDLSLAMPQGFQELEPRWKITLPPLISNDRAMFLGVIFGIMASFSQSRLTYRLLTKLEKLVSYFLTFITAFIPLFVTGFIIKLDFEDTINRIIEDYGMILAVICLVQFTYLSFLYFALAHFNIKRTLQSIQNMLPAAITGFSAMSSMTAMPLAIIGTEKNVKNKELAYSIIPATINIHLIGDSIAIPIFAFAVLKNYAIPEPSFYLYFIFALYFIIAKFSVAAIPGGSILVMLPILEAHLGFNAEMLSLITALYVLFDPIVTTANVFGHGAFAMIVEKFFTFFKKKPLLIKE